MPASSGAHVPPASSRGGFNKMRRNKLHRGLPDVVWLPTLYYKFDVLTCDLPPIEMQHNSIHQRRTMSNSPNNREQSQKIDLTPTQENPGAARPEDFIIEDRDEGQRGDGKAERAALLAEADKDAKSNLREPTPTRNEVPHKRWVK
jgi:hypothetical protein